MPPKTTAKGKSSGKGRGGGSGRGRGRPKVIKETEAQRVARELVEAKKHQLIEYVKQYPVMFDISHPDK